MGCLDQIEEVFVSIINLMIGMKSLIDMIKVTKVPIICICNDKYNPKMKSL